MDDKEKINKMANEFKGFSKKKKTIIIGLTVFIGLGIVFGKAESVEEYNSRTKADIEQREKEREDKMEKLKEDEAK